MHSCVSLMFWGCLSLLTELQSFRSTEFLTYTVTVTQFVVEGPICKNIGFGVSEGRILTLCDCRMVRRGPEASVFVWQIRPLRAFVVITTAKEEVRWDSVNMYQFNLLLFQSSWFLCETLVFLSRVPPAECAEKNSCFLHKVFKETSRKIYHVEFSVDHEGRSHREADELYTTHYYRFTGGLLTTENEGSAWFWLKEVFGCGF